MGGMVSRMGAKMQKGLLFTSDLFGEIHNII
jgi:hypothetical protein